MNMTVWSRATLTKRLVEESFQKYGHYLKWKNHKENIMEIGCANGAITGGVLYPYVKSIINKITAVDIDSSLIETAKSQNEIKEIDFRVMDVMDDKQVEKIRGQFDHIFAFHVPHWIPDHRTFLDGLHKMLKPNGQIYVSHVVTSPFHESFHRHFREGTWSKYLPQKRIMLYYTDDPVGYISKIVKEAGFKTELCEHEKKRDPIEDYTGFMRPLISICPYIDRIPAVLREAYYQDHLKHIFEHSTYLGEPEIYELRYELLTCVASKET